MSIDLSPIVPALATLILGALTTAISIAARALIAHLHIANGAALAAQIDQAANSAAGEAYRQAVLHGHDLTIPAGQNAAVAIAANYVLARVPDALKQAGVTPDAVDGLVASRLGKLLAVDPTVSPKPASTDAPEPANDAQPAPATTVPAA